MHSAGFKTDPIPQPPSAGAACKSKRAAGSGGTFPVLGWLRREVGLAGNSVTAGGWRNPSDKFFFLASPGAGRASFRPQSGGQRRGAEPGEGPAAAAEGPRPEAKNACGGEQKERTRGASQAGSSGEGSSSQEEEVAPSPRRAPGVWWRRRRHCRAPRAPAPRSAPGRAGGSQFARSAAAPPPSALRPPPRSSGLLPPSSPSQQLAPTCPMAALSSGLAEESPTDEARRPSRGSESATPEPGGAIRAGLRLQPPGSRPAGRHTGCRGLPARCRPGWGRPGREGLRAARLSGRAGPAGVWRERSRERAPADPGRTVAGGGWAACSCGWVKSQRERKESLKEQEAY